MSQMKHLSIMFIVYVLHCENIFYIKKERNEFWVWVFLVLNIQKAWEFSWVAKLVKEHHIPAHSGNSEKKALCCTVTAIVSFLEHMSHVRCVTVVWIKFLGSAEMESCLTDSFIVWSSPQEREMNTWPLKVRGSESLRIPLQDFIMWLYEQIIHKKQLISVIYGLLKTAT